MYYQTCNSNILYTIQLTEFKTCILSLIHEYINQLYEWNNAYQTLIHLSSTFIIIFHAYKNTSFGAKVETIYQGHPRDEVYMYQSILPFLVTKRNVLKLTKLTRNLLPVFLK